MMFPDAQLTLFAVTDGVPDNLTYLVWISDEPEVWVYRGMDSQRFDHLAAFLESNIQI